MIKKYFFAVSIVLLSNFPAIGQGLTNSNLESQSGPSTNASGGGLADNISIDQYTGKLQEGFTIFNYQNRSTGLSHSINIGYKGGGIGVDDISSNIGLGWSLNTGGSVIRQINGLPDEGAYSNTGALALAGFTAAPPIVSPTPTGSDLDEYSGDYTDGQYDDFYYSAGTQTGTFHIGKDRSILQIPITNVKIVQLLNGYSASAAPSDSCYSISYIITLLDGTKYIYSNHDCSKLNPNSTNSYDNRVYASRTWYLSKIIAPFNKDSVCFDYTPVVQSYIGGMAYSSYFIDASLSGSPVVKDTFYVLSRDMRLTDIRYTDGTVVNFNYDSFPRLDVPSDHALNNITITNGSTSYGYKFNYSYIHNFNTGGLDPLNPYAYKNYSSSPPSDTNQTDYRLILNNYNKFSGTDSLPGTTFFYYPAIPVPRGTLSSVDHWGYYSSIAGTRVPTSSSDSTISRDANIGSENSSLQEIILPTGGNVKLEYENNSYKDTLSDITYPVGATYQTSTITNMIGIPNGYFYGFGDPSYEYVEELSPDPPSGGLKAVTFTFTYNGSVWPGVPAHFTIYSMHINVVINFTSTTSTDYGTVVFTPTDFGPKTFTILVPSTLADHSGLGFEFYYTAAGVYTPPYTGPFEPSFKVTVESKVVNTTVTLTHINKNTGGIRVKKMVVSDSTGQNNKIVKSYQYNNDDGFSSGIAGNIPIYDYQYEEIASPTVTDHLVYNPIFGVTYSAATPSTTYSFNVFTSQAENSLLLTRGSPVGYGKVEEYIGTPANYEQKTVYNFTNQFSDTIGLGTLYNNRFPYPPVPNLDFISGLPLSVYNYNSAGLLLAKTVNQYNIFLAPQNGSNYVSIQAGIKTYPTNNDTTNFLFKEYYPVSGKVFTTSTMQTSYFAGGDSMVNTVQYVYDTAKMVTKQIMTTDSRGVPVITKYYYPFDFSITGAITQLQDSGMIYSPIRTEIWKDTVSPYLVSSSVSLFQQLTDGSVKPQSLCGLAVNTPVSSAIWGSFNNTQLLQNSSLFTQLGTMDQYDNYGNLLQVTNRGISNSTIWGYNKQLPIASIANAVNTDVAYTSFEGSDVALGNWSSSGTISIVSGGFTGINAATLGGGTIGSSGILSKNGLDPSKTYLLSFWVESGVGTIPSVSTSSGSVSLVSSDSHRGWTLYKATFLGAVSVTVSNGGGLAAPIDELRLYPLGAAITTSTYDPLFGVTSKSDATNRTVYFEHDDFGRLKVVRDLDGKIIEKYDYKTQDHQ